MRAPLAALALFSACAAAQDCTNVAALLHSSDLSAKAWGAYLAASCAQRERGPQLAFELEQMLPDRAAGPNAPEYWLIQSLLDALIQLQQPVAPSTLLAFEQERPNESLILLIQNAHAAQQPLLFLLDTRLTDPQWLAATNTLLSLKTPRFAAKLLRETRFTLTLTVLDPEFGAGYGGSAGGGIFGDGLGGISVPQDFPPVGLYSMVLTAAPGDTLLAAGTHPVYFRRTVAQPGQPANRHGDGGANRESYALEHLAALSGMTIDSVRSAVHAIASVSWKDPKSFLKDRDAAVAAQRDAFRRLTGGLQSAGALSSDDAASLVIRVVTHIEDLRRDRSVAVPAVPEFEMRISEPAAL